MLVKFEESQFNNIFPFYILLNAELNVVSCGDTLKKFFPGLASKPNSCSSIGIMSSPIS